MSEKPKTWVSVKCPFCGESHGQYLAHYDLLKGGCGRVFWALRPNRGGPLKLFIWPGWAGMTPQQSASMLTVKK